MRYSQPRPHLSQGLKSSSTRLRGQARLGGPSCLSRRWGQLRSIYHATTAKGREIDEEGPRQLPHLPDPRDRPARPHPARLEVPVLAYFDTSGVSNGGTKAINLIIEKVRRLAHGFRDFDHYRTRIRLAADGRRPYRRQPTHA